MEYKQREDGTAGMISTGLRERFEVDDGRFEVPDDLDAAAHERLIDAGHTPIDPGQLPESVSYDADENAESASSSDSEEETSEESEESEEEASDEESNASGSVTSDQLKAEEVPEPPEALEEMNRSELYQYGNEELGLSLEWSGDGALNEAEMRGRISEEVPDGE